MKRGDIKRFREYLNGLPQTTPHRHHRYRQRVRKYGDYLYHQDREKFMVDLKEWVEKGRPE